MMKRVFELRYEVYCQERGFLPVQDYPDGLEFDEYDERSAHFCEFDESDDLVGYVRLVRAEQLPDFPFMNHCSSVDFGSGPPQVDQCAEISRLIVHPSLRRRRNDTNVEPGFASATRASMDDRRRQSRLILPALYRQMYVYSRRAGIRYWYAAMERPLARHMMQLGFPFQQIGPLTDYYGPVAPYLLDLTACEAALASRNPALLDWMCTALRDCDSAFDTLQAETERFGGSQPIAARAPHLPASLSSKRPAPAYALQEKLAA